ncbi:MAG: ubiquinone biosynthesis hydroxylase family protein [Proteobacteria bacterium]|nr:ubiquinone biosynthesis hydroxylase family protein [Pseudomonadota bacterium]
MSSSNHFDILIVGGGLAGASLACALRGSRFRVGLIERQSPVLASGWDARIYAISPVNVAFLQRCGAWDHLPRERIVPVEKMDVRGDAGGALAFSAYECGLQALAWIVESGRMAEELWQTARRQPNISVLCPASPVALSIDAEAATLRLEDGRQLSAGLVVAADGVNSWVRTQAGITTEMRPYGELGVVANFKCEKPHFGTAFQWFRPDGVLAYLPLPGNQISIVWSTPEAHAQELLALGPEDFCARVAEAGGQQLGSLELVTPPAGFPLRWMKAQTLAAPRLALIGDAAHAVHPLSGHGINLGFQDAQALADVLLALPAFRDCGDVTALQRYARARAEETLLVRGATDGLQRLFRTDLAPLNFLRNAGMNLVGAISPLRSVLARYAAGLF